MSLEKDFIVHDTHTRFITALGCSSSRREIYLGFEDGVVKVIEIDTTSLVNTFNEHKGWITCFLYWTQTKLLFCSSNDGLVTVIGSGGILLDKIFIGHAIYCMALNNRRQEIIFGVTNGLQFHNLYETKEGLSHYIDSKSSFRICEHTDIVRNIVVIDSRIYSTGYDGALVIYDCQYADNTNASKFFKNPHAHEAGIACLIVEKDSVENTVWVFTGSFDKTLKVWTGDGKIIHKFDGFNTGVTGLCFSPKNRTIWCAAGSNSAFIYDPKTGEDVTEFIDTFIEEKHSIHSIQLLKYLNEFNMLLATTSHKQLIVYKYNPNGALTSLKFKVNMDSLCYTSKIPILIFTGDTSGDITKWEQRQASQIIYNSENLIKSELVVRESSRMQGLRETSKQAYQKKQHEQYLKNKDLAQIKKTNVILRMIFVERLDLILAACEDSSIYVWGFDQDAVNILKNMKYEEKMKFKSKKSTTFRDEVNRDEKNNYLEKIDYIKYLNNLNTSCNQYETSSSEKNSSGNEQNSKTKINEESESVTNRVAGFILLKILSEHTSCVTSLAVVERPDLYPSTYLISSGWDRRICIWDLDRLRLFDIFRNSSTTFDEIELASDGNILDMCYCPKKNVFGYSTTDSMCYIRKFSTKGSDMTLVDTLQGHLSEVTCIQWFKKKSRWITGGEDTTIRIWSENCECIQVINCLISVNAICIDHVEDALIVACHDLIKVYELDDYHLVQTNYGHTDSIRDVIFIPERNNIVSVSWDGTIKIWKSYRKQNAEQKKKSKESNKKFDTWVWDQMKLAMKGKNTFDINEYSKQLITPIYELNENNLILEEKFES